MTPTSSSERVYELIVEGSPPVKQPPADAAERMRQKVPNDLMAAAHADRYGDRWQMWLYQVDLRLEIRYERGSARSDSANIIGGIADALEKLNVYWSDAQLRTIDYAETRAHGGRDRYVVRVRSSRSIADKPAATTSGSHTGAA
jgi:Holliday junction resolvase RusA-like endonuclease